MKKIVSFVLSLAFAGSTFAQMSGYSSSSYSDGTTLGANETLTADGIALGNAVKLRGYVDFMFSYLDWEDDYQGEEFSSSTDVDFLFDLSPITAELHLTADADDGADLEQVFGRYSLNDDFHMTFGRQLTVLGYEADEAPGLYAVSYGHILSSRVIGDKLLKDDQDVLKGLRRTYVDGLRANYNNGMFGLTFGMHDGYWLGDNFDGDNLAIDIAASVMFFPGLEARLGYAHQSLDVDLLEEVGKAFNTSYTPNSDGDIGQFNAWLAYSPGALTIATELDNYSLDLGRPNDIDYWSWMLLGSYQFSDWVAGTLRYTHEDIDLGAGVEYDSDRISFAVLFTLTEHFGVNVEYSTTSTDSSANAVSSIGNAGDLDEFYVEGLITY
jgi:hypothetical protein